MVAVGEAVHDERSEQVDLVAAARGVVAVAALVFFGSVREGLLECVDAGNLAAFCAGDI